MGFLGSAGVGQSALPRGSDILRIAPQRARLIIMRAYPTIDGTLSPTPAAPQIVDNVVVPGPPMTATNPAPAPAPAHVERSRDTIDPAPVTIDKTATKPAGETA